MMAEEAKKLPERPREFATVFTPFGGEFGPESKMQIVIWSLGIVVAALVVLLSFL